jgi:hypothetical protein
MLWTALKYAPGMTLGYSRHLYADLVDLCGAPHDFGPKPLSPLEPEGFYDVINAPSPSISTIDPIMRSIHLHLPTPTVISTGELSHWILAQG